MNRIALFPGTFDPFTVGHANIVERALPLFDKIVIAIGINEAKHTLQPLEQRLEAIRKVYREVSRVEVESYDTLTIDFARKVGAQFILRGLRTIRDFEYEREIADLNRSMSGIETVMFFTAPELACVSSSSVRELMAFGKDVSKFLP